MTERVVSKYLDCRIPHRDFARIRCGSCGEEAILPFSCKQRAFCTSCTTKRSAVWAGLMRETVLQPYPHHHVVFSMPKMLRPHFHFHRALLRELCGCGWAALKIYMLSSLQEGVLPAAVISLATASDALQWHPHLHCLVLAGGIAPDGTFARCPALNESPLRQLFEAEVYKLLLAKEQITPAVVENIRSWKHSGFHAYAGPATMTTEEAVRVALYGVRAPAAVGRLTVDSTRPILNYLPKGLRPSSLLDVPTHQFDYLDWIARLTSHIHEPRVHTVGYFGAYSNAHRGRAASLSGSGTGPAKTLAQSPVREESEWSRSRRCSWATLLKQIWLVDPLLCRCGGQMRIVAFIQDRPVIDKTLAHIDYRLEVLSLPAVPRAPPPPEPDWNNQDYALPF